MGMYPKFDPSWYFKKTVKLWEVPWLLMGEEPPTPGQDDFAAEDLEYYRALREKGGRLTDPKVLSKWKSKHFRRQERLRKVRSLMFEERDDASYTNRLEKLEKRKTGDEKFGDSADINELVEQLNKERNREVSADEFGRKAVNEKYFQERRMHWPKPPRVDHVCWADSDRLRREISALPGDCLER